MIKPMRFFCFILLLFTHVIVQAQKKQIQIADDFYEDLLLKDARLAYEEVYKEFPNLNLKTRQHVLGQLARCNQYSFRYTQAEQYYDLLLKTYDQPKPELILEYAIMLKFNGKYKEARNQFRNYQKMTKGEDLYGSFHMRSVNWAINNDTVNKPVFLGITNLNISGQCMGFAPFQDGIIYAHARNKEPFYSMQIFDLDFAERIDSLHFQESENMLDSINFNSNESGPSLSANGKILYFSANASTLKNGMVSKKSSESNKEGVMNLKVYQSRWNGSRFTQITELEFNSLEYNCTHPHINETGDILYFVSDMPGGFGGFDIYMCRKDKTGNWGRPINLGKSINSEENDLYPHTKNGKFYYASKGLNGYGGYDLYIAKLNPNGTASAPQNMGKPINSYRDELSMILLSDGRSGYFTSNRGNDDGEDEVYYFRTYAELDEVPPSYLEPVAALAVKTDTVQPIKTVPVAVVTETKPIQESPEPVKIPEADNSETALNDDEVLLKRVFNNVNFKFNTSELESSVKSTLDSAAAAIRSGKHIKIEISAHTDSRGSETYNKKLSVQRADNARKYLLMKGVPASRILARGYGETMLLNDCVDGKNCTEEQHSLNRRVELKLVR